jgi:hypothetical protein
MRDRNSRRKIFRGSEAEMSWKVCVDVRSFGVTKNCGM